MVPTTLASVGFTPGWATFGEALPQGDARGGLQVGTLPTQTDVKTLWPDGSIRFAVVTASIPTTGFFPITAAAPTSGNFAPTLPNASVRFTINGVLYTAALPQAPSSDVWLSGPDVLEARYTVTPLAPDNTPHPFLRVLFDVRSYAGGGTRLDVTVDNTLDVASATQVNYSVDIVAGGQTLYHHDNVSHYYLTRWRQVFDLGLNESQVTPDFTTFYQANALPQYLSTIANLTYSTVGPTFDILGRGGLTYDAMDTVGGRPEIAPYPDWTAQYLVHEAANQWQFVKANGTLAGSWPVHIQNPDNSLISIDQRPNYWLDPRWYPYGDGPVGDNRLSNTAALGPLVPDIAHQPSLAYVPYLVTGDRYDADEMKYWANYVIIATWPGNNNADRQGSQGLLVQNQTRGIAWGLRNMVDAAAYLPDNDPTKSYLVQKVANNIAWLNQYASSHQTPLGTIFDNNVNDGDPRMWMSVWENNYVAWSIDHANQQGFTGGSAMRDLIARFQLTLFTSPQWSAQNGGPGWLSVGQVNPDQTHSYFSTLNQVYQSTFPSGVEAPPPLDGYYGVDARLSLMFAIRNGWAGAQSAFDYVNSQIGSDDLINRSGWSIAFTPPSGIVATVTSINPRSGSVSGGSVVTITGTGFTGASSVLFGTTATSFTVNSDISITAIAPRQAAGIVDVRVRTAGGTSATSTSDQFSYVGSVPVVIGVSPAEGSIHGGTTINVTGTGFTGATIVLFGGTPVGFTVNSDTSITAVAPPGTAGVVHIVVTTSNGTSATSSADQFTYLIPAPVVTALNPANGNTRGGATVTISGTGFTGATAVYFGNAPAAFTVNSDLSITAVAPPHPSGTVAITVVTPAGTSMLVAADQFTYSRKTNSGNWFVTGLDGQIYAQSASTTGNSLRGYTLVRPGKVQSVAVGQVASGAAEVFAIGMDHQVYGLTFDTNNNATGNYFLTASGQVKTLSVGSDAQSRPETFVIGLDDQVYAENFDATGLPLSNYFLTATGRVRFLAVSNDSQTQRPETFVIGLDDQVYAERFDDAGKPLGSYFLTSAGRVKSISVAADASGGFEVFAIGLDDQVYEQALDQLGNSMGGYLLTAPGQVKSLQATTDSNGHTLVLVVGRDDQLYAAKSSVSPSTTSDYFLVSSGRIKAVSAGEDGRGQAEALVIGMDDQVYVQHWDATGIPLGTYGLTAPGAVLSMIHT